MVEQIVRPPEQPEWADRTARAGSIDRFIPNFPNDHQPIKAQFQAVLGHSEEALRDSFLREIFQQINPEETIALMKELVANDEINTDREFYQALLDGIGRKASYNPAKKAFMQLSSLAGEKNIMQLKLELCPCLKELMDMQN